jgi:hypothetical protein
MIDHALIILRETNTWEVVLGNQRDSFTWHPWVIPNVQCGQSFVDGRLPHRSEAKPVLPILLQPINHMEDIWWFPLLSVHKSASVMLGLALSNIVNLESCKMETNLESAMLLRHLSNPNKQYITARQESARMFKKNWKTEEQRSRQWKTREGSDRGKEKLCLNPEPLTSQCSAAPPVLQLAAVALSETTASWSFPNTSCLHR